MEEQPEKWQEEENTVLLDEWEWPLMIRDITTCDSRKTNAEPGRFDTPTCDASWG